MNPFLLYGHQWQKLKASGRSADVSKMGVNGIVWSVGLVEKRNTGTRWEAMPEERQIMEITGLQVTLARRRLGTASCGRRMLMKLTLLKLLCCAKYSAKCGLKSDLLKYDPVPKLVSTADLYFYFCLSSPLLIQTTIPCSNFRSFWNYH